MKRSTRIKIGLFAVGGLLLAGLLPVAFPDSHHTDFRYILWKHHLQVGAPYDGLRWLNADADFRMSLYGKTRPEIERWFPDLRPINPSDAYLPYCGEEVHKPGFVWIGDSRWGILFENGRVTDINLFKG